MATMSAKRKRDSQDMPGMRAPPAMNPSAHDFDASYLHTDEIENPEHMNMPDFAAMIGQTHAHEEAVEEGHDDRHAQQTHPPHAVVPGGAGPSPSDTAAAAMAYHTMTVPQSTEQSFLQQNAGVTGERQDDESVEPGSAQQRTSGFDDFDVTRPKDHHTSSNGDTSPTSPLVTPSNPNAPKPAVGSDEWHKIRRDNHKEVERRRRETINEGINELAKIVPGCEKNKGSILARAVQFITQLKENETQNIEKWTLEKLLTEQAIAELSSSCDKLKAECQRAWAECEQWKKAAQRAGASIDADDKVDGAANAD